MINVMYRDFSNISYHEVVKLKNELLEKLANIMDKRSYERALRDDHTYRVPRACGITVHTAIGCPNACLYCYIQDMGFEFRSAKPYPLNGMQIVVSLLANEYFLPGLTYLAFGSVSDPFISKPVSERTLEYIHHISSYLGNPIQFSTKAFLDERLVERLKSYRRRISPLITIVTIEKSNILEPNAPPPELRLETITNLRKAGFKPFLFLRPIMPGINVDEIDELLNLAKQAGAYGVVIGGFRITRRIIDRLSKAGFDVTHILRRIGKKRRLTNKQVNIVLADIKRQVLKQAKEHGLRAVLSACCAMTIVLNENGENVPCANCCFANGMCVEQFCGNNCRTKVPEISLDDLKIAIEDIFDTNVKDIEKRGYTLYVYLKGRARSLSRKYIQGKMAMLSTLYRHRIVVKL